MVFVATAAKGLAEEAIRSTRPGAKILLFAQTSDKERIELSGASICVGERSLLGSYSASVELQAESARLVFSGELLSACSFPTAFRLIRLNLRSDWRLTRVSFLERTL